MTDDVKGNQRSALYPLPSLCQYSILREFDDTHPLPVLLYTGFRSHPLSDSAPFCVCLKRPSLCQFFVWRYSHMDQKKIDADARPTRIEPQTSSSEGRIILLPTTKPCSRGCNILSESSRRLNILMIKQISTTEA